MRTQGIPSTFKRLPTPWAAALGTTLREQLPRASSGAFFGGRFEGAAGCSAAPDALSFALHLCNRPIPGRTLRSSSAPSGSAAIWPSPARAAA